MLQIKDLRFNELLINCQLAKAGALSGTQTLRSKKKIAKNGWEEKPHSCSCAEEKDNMPSTVVHGYNFNTLGG